MRSQMNRKDQDIDSTAHVARGSCMNIKGSVTRWVTVSTEGLEKRQHNYGRIASIGRRPLYYAE